jgi:probable O-glycosylation ligase (exosortase A-associated)
VSLFTLAGLALWRPWLGVLALVFFSYMQPHAYADGFMRAFPVSQILFGATVLGLLFTRERSLPGLDWRIGLMVALWLSFIVTSYFALVDFLVWPKFIEVSKTLAIVGLSLVLIDTTTKLRWMMYTIALSIALVTLKGGYWAIIHGFSDRVYGPPGSQYADNNHFAVAAVMSIPLLVFWYRQASELGVRSFLLVAIALSYVAVLTSWSRGGLLALAAVSLLLLWHSRRRHLALSVMVGGVALAYVMMPDAWLARMEFFGDFNPDESAQGRLTAWRDGLALAMRYPFTGVGFDGWVLYTYAANMVGRDWHSIYVEMLAEHGFLVFALWATLLFGSILSLSRLAWRHARNPELAWASDMGLMLRASLVGYAVGGAFLGLSYWDLPYQIIVLSALLAGFVREHEPSGVPSLSASVTGDGVPDSVLLDDRASS